MRWLGKLKWLKNAPWIPIIMLGIIVFCIVFANLVTSTSPTAVSLENRMLPPGSKGFIFGTDPMGRDMLSRTIYGGRASLIVAFFTIVIAGSVGLTVGIIAGYFGGKVDSVLMRIVDIFLSFPPILLAIIFAVSMGPGIKTVIIAVSVCYWSRFSRIIRAEVLQIKEQEYIALAKTAGCSSLYIMVRHILPNVIDTFLVVASLQIGMVIATESTLSFLGAGISPPTPSWGSMIGTGRDYIDSAWWVTVIPGTFLGLTILAFNMIGDWARDMMDPQLRAILSVRVPKEKRWLAGLSRLWQKNAEIAKRK